MDPDWVQVLGLKVTQVERNNDLRVAVDCSRRDMAIFGSLVIRAILGSYPATQASVKLARNSDSK